MLTDIHATTPLDGEEPIQVAPATSAGATPPFATNSAPAPYAPNESAGTGAAAGRSAWPHESIGLPPGMPPNDSTGLGNRHPSRRRPGWRGVVAAVAVVVALAGGIAIGHALPQQSSPTLGSTTTTSLTVSSNVASLQQTVQSVAKAVAPSVVEITSVGRGSEGIGSGVVLTADGYIVTNDHVVAGFTSYTVTLSNGSKLQARLVGEDPTDDLAVLKVDASNLKPITFADSSQVTVGTFVVAVGNPYGLRETATFGTVSAINRTASESPSGPASLLTGLIQMSAPIAPGNSGGALVNLQGQLIGIPTLGESSQQTGSSGTTTVGFAISSNEVKSVAQQLIQQGHVTSTGTGFLGIQGQDVTPQLASANGLSVTSGVLVASFANDAAGQSPAQQAGLQAGDVIIAINGQAISDSSDLAAAVATQAPGKQVSVTVARGTQHVTLTLTLTLGERPLD